MTAVRLHLLRPSPADVPELFGLYADPLVWGPDPLSRHRDVTQTETMVGRWLEGWDRDGLGMWVARSTEPGTVDELVGIGGCFVRYGVAWNLGFRLQPRFWGQGYAQEISAEAMAAATKNRADLPMTAYVLEGNDKSQRAVERTGLRQIWRGADAGNPDTTAVRLLYADRDLAAETLQVLTAH